MEILENYYTVKYGCGNCCQDFKAAFKKGEIAPSKTECPHCGTSHDTAKKY